MLCGIYIHRRCWVQFFLCLFIFKPLEGGPASPLPKEDEELPVLNSRVVYIGRIPHGFYEDQMQGSF